MPHVPALPSIGGLHDDHVVELLRSGAHAALLGAYFGEIEYRELCLLAKLAAIRRDPRGPIVFVLPGIMGSKLGAVHGQAVELVWLHPNTVSTGGLLQLALPSVHDLTALGVMLPGYLKLKLSLEIAGFAPVFHPFDWRQDLTVLGRTLNAAIERCGARQVAIVGHSMGGLVARAALEHDGDKRIARLIQLGAPNNGSFAPVQALRAVYPTVRKIAALDSNHTAEKLAQQVFRTLPGLYHLLPSKLDGDALDLFDPHSWPQDDLAPDARLLARARAVRSHLAEADERCYAVAGIHQETITSVAEDESGFVYRITRDGDGTVPLRLARWSDAATWYVEANHGAMTTDDRVIAAVIDLLSSGNTSRLSRKPPLISGELVREISDRELRSQATAKVHWDSLSIDSRRRILEPVLTVEFTNGRLAVNG